MVKEASGIFKQTLNRILFRSGKSVLSINNLNTNRYKTTVWKQITTVWTNEVITFVGFLNCKKLKKSKMQKTIFITGASAGLGKATAKLFQSKGWNVIATMRNPEKETELAQLENVTLLPLDVTNLKQIKTTVAKAISSHNIDVVFNNAGYGLMGAREAFSDEQILKQISTNLLGVMRVTQAFIPYFREKKSGLFISTTSIGGLLGFPLHSIYQATKFAIEGWSESMSFELGLHNIQIKTIAPGGIATDFTGRSLDRNSHPQYHEIEDKLYSTVDNMNAASTADQIAAVVYEAATDGKDQVRYIAGEDAKAMYARRLELGSEESRKEIRKQILG
ncbi:MAG: SDR family oxidoreductase [Mucilaginibacter sp.]|uniref:SDR family oxidoreductase n=1 Tax=Mucilaginibacter sp. TaxID=1882438 RepID=UPI0034E3F9A7